MEVENVENIGVANELVILEVMDTVEEIIDSHPESSFAFGLTTPMESKSIAKGVLRKILFVGKSGLETLKVLSSLHNSYSIRKNFRHLGFRDLAKIGTQGAAVALYLVNN